MKKYSFLLSVFSALVLLGCGNKNQVTITGTSEDESLNGQYIYLQERIEREWITLDSAKIDNGKFSFQGLSDSSRIAYFRVLPVGANNPFVREFVYEKGNINVNIDKDGFFTIKGTVENDALQTYAEAENVIVKKMEEFEKSLTEDVETADSVKSRLYAEMNDKLTDELKDISTKFAKEKANTIAGVHVFLNSFYYYTMEEKENVIATFNDATRKIKRVSEIIADTETEKKVAVGQPYVNFTQATVTGDSLSLSDLVGKTDYILIDFWASWCPPCIRSFPELTAFYNKYKGKQFEILGVSLDRKDNEWKDAITKYNLTWKHVSDLKYWQNAVARTYAVNSIPSTVLIDKNGTIVAKNANINEIEMIILGKK